MLWRHDVDDMELVDYLKGFLVDKSNGSIQSSSPPTRRKWLYLPMHAIVMWCPKFMNSMRQALFGRESIPAELEVFGEKIVQACRNFILSIEN